MSYKILRNIEMDLSPQSISNAIREVKQFRKDLLNICGELTRRLTEQGIEIAKMQLISMDANWTGYLEKSIQGVYFAGERCGVIYTDIYYALFVEYGSGFVGAHEDYPGEYAPGYQPDEMGHGIEGWWYPAPWGWYIPKGGDPLAWTKGMPPRPFMYNTLKWLEEVAESEGIKMFSQM